MLIFGRQQTVLFGYLIQIMYGVRKLIGNISIDFKLGHSVDVSLQIKHRNRSYINNVPYAALSNLSVIPVTVYLEIRLLENYKIGS